MKPNMSSAQSRHQEISPDLTEIWYRPHVTAAGRGSAGSNVEARRRANGAVENGDEDESSELVSWGDAAGQVVGGEGGGGESGGSVARALGGGAVSACSFAVLATIPDVASNGFVHTRYGAPTEVSSGHWLGVLTQSKQ